MTTYGTIPTSSNPDLEMVSRANTWIQSELEAQRPWKDFLAINSLSFPSSFNEVQLRIRPNLAHFRINYAMLMLAILFLSLIWHPISLIVFIAMMAAWLFLYFLRDAPLVVLGRVIDDLIVLLVLGVLTVVFLVITDVAANIVTAVTVAAAVVVAHAVVRRTDDLPLAGDFDDEAGTRVVYRTSSHNVT